MYDIITNELNSIYEFCKELDKESIGIDSLINTDLSTADFVISDIITYLSLLCSCDNDVSEDELWVILNNLNISNHTLDRLSNIVSCRYDKIDISSLYSTVSDSIQILVKADMLKLGDGNLYSIKLLNVYKCLGDEIITADGKISDEEAYYYNEFIKMLKTYISRKLAIHIL